MRYFILLILFIGANACQSVNCLQALENKSNRSSKKGAWCLDRSIDESLQNKVVFKGVIKDRQTGDGVAGYFVLDADSKLGVQADENGNFQMTAPAGQYKIKFQHLGNKTLALKPLVFEANEIAEFTVHLGFELSD